MKVLSALRSGKTTNSLLNAGILVLLAAAPAAAQGEWDSVTARTGALVAQLGSTLRFDTQAGQLGTSIDLEKELGFQTTNTTFFADGTCVSPEEISCSSASTTSVGASPT